MKPFVLLLAAFLFVWAEETLLHFSHTFETTLVPDRIATRLVLDFRHEQSRNAQSHAQEAIKMLTNASSLCSGGGIGLRPEYRHREGRSERIGFIATIDLRCESGDAEGIDRLIVRSREAAERFEGTLTLSPPKRTVSTRQRLDAQNRLEQEAIGWATRRLSALAEQFAQRQCQLHELRLEPMRTPAGAVRMMQTETHEPLNSEEPFSLTLNWSARCQ